MQCETCSTEIATPEDAHSMIVVLQKVTPNGYSYYQCDAGNLVNGMRFQHWHCTHEEMVDGVKNCIVAHYREEMLISVPPEQVQLHITVLDRNRLRCLVCQQPLTTQAYRFCLTHAEPVNYVPDASMNELGEWCCSLEHAKQSALKYIY